MTETDPKPNDGKTNPTPQDEGTQEPRNDDPLDKFSQIKERYEKELSDKDKIIKDLQDKLSKKDNEVNDTIDELNDEVNEKLQQTQKIQDLQATVNELVEERAEATVDAYIQKGIILPSQKEAAKKLCLTDNDTFLDLYRDAKPIVETHKQRKSVPTGTAERIANYFKN